MLGGMAQPLLAAMQGISLQVPPANPPPSQSPADEARQVSQDSQQSHDQSEAPPPPPPDGGGSGRSSTSSLNSPPRWVWSSCVHGMQLTHNQCFSFKKSEVLRVQVTQIPSLIVYKLLVQKVVCSCFLVSVSVNSGSLNLHM